MDWLDWLLLIARVAVVFFALLISVLLYVWMERKVIADFQTRKGPMRAGPRGILITLADGIKLFFKEGITPTNADRPVYAIAPVLAILPAFLAFAVIPFGMPVTLWGRTVPLQLADLDIGILWVLAMTSIGVYAVVLAGWSSGSNYPLLGSIRSTAQMVSYEVAMGLALVAVLLYSGHLRMTEIVAQQDTIWNAIPQFPAFVVFLICGLAETNRPPFDLAEAESELVAGFHTEYSGIKFALFYLGEYVNTVTVAAIAVTLFLGGWRGPHPDFLLVAVADPVVPVQGHRGDLRLHPGPGNVAADALRPTDELRLEAVDPVRPAVGAGDGVRRRRPGPLHPQGAVHGRRGRVRRAGARHADRPVVRAQGEGARRRSSRARSEEVTS